MTVTETEVKDERVEWMRGEFDWLQGKMDIVGPVLGKAFVRAKLKTWRHVITVPVKDMPKLDEMYAFLRRPEYSMRDLVKLIEFESSYRQMSIDRLKFVLSWPEFYRSKIDKIKNRHPVHKDKIRSLMLKNRQNAAGEPDPLTQVQVTVDEKEVGRVYKKYVKAYKEDDLTDPKWFVDDYYRRKKT